MEHTSSKKALISLFLFFLLFFVLILNTGCARFISLFATDSGGSTPTGSVTPDSGSPDSGGGYFPNVDGYYWQYKATFPGGTTGEFVMSFEGSVSLSGLYYQRVVKTYSAGSDVLTQEAYYWVTSSGVWNFGEGDIDNLTTEAQYKFLGFPLSNNKTWTVMSAQTIDAIAYQNIPVTVEAGTFTNTYKIVVRSRGTIEMFSVYLAYGVGQVRIEWPFSPPGDGGGDGIATYELKNASFLN
jgi:hypothetical protein